MKNATKAINSIVFTLLVAMLSKRESPMWFFGQVVLGKAKRNSGKKPSKQESDDSLYMQILRNKDDETHSHADVGCLVHPP